ncbi:MAG: STAS/SEC14 domain-containing protein [Candidatus Andersenbacteria bacterium]
MVHEEVPETTFSLSVDDHNIIHLAFLHLPEKIADHKPQAEAVRKRVVKLLQKNPQQQHDVLVDSSAVRHTPFLSMDAQAIYLDLMKQPQIKRLAFVAYGRFLKIMTSVFTQFTGKGSSVKWFDDKDQALAWLHQKA